MTTELPRLVFYLQPARGLTPEQVRNVLKEAATYKGMSLSTWAANVLLREAIDLISEERKMKKLFGE